MIKRIATLASLITILAAPVSAQEVYLVNFTAEFCPSCRILDPRLEEATHEYPKDKMQRVILDFTSPETSEAAYQRVNGTILANPYADYIGITGLGVLTAADSGETIECVTASMTSDVIRSYIDKAVEIVAERPVGKRGVNSAMCPNPNVGVRID